MSLNGSGENELDLYKKAATPVGFGAAYLDLTYYEWQANFLNALIPEGSRIAGAFANESGKTSVIDVTAIFWHMWVFPHSKTIYMSATNNQIDLQLRPNIQRYVDQWQHLGWEYTTSQKFYVKAPNGSTLVAYSTKRAGFAEGHHKHGNLDIYNDWEPPEEWDIKSKEKARIRKSRASLMIILDECKSIDDSIFFAVERCHATRVILNSSTGEPAGFHYEAFHDKNSHYTYTAKCTVWDCPHLKEDKPIWDHLMGQLRVWGKNHWFIKSTLYSEWAQDDETCVFDMESVERAMSGMVKQIGYDKAAAIDFALGGANKTVLAVRKGNHAWIEKRYKEADAKLLAKTLVADLRRLKISPETVDGDTGGMGEAIISVMDGYGYAINRVNFGAKSRVSKYFNKRAEMYFELDYKLRIGRISIHKDDHLRRQFMLIKEKVSYEGEGRKLESKDNLAYSPDELDAMVMVFNSMLDQEIIDVDEPATYKEFSTIGDPEQIRRQNNSLVPQGVYFN